MLKRFIPVFAGLLLIWSCTPSPRYTVEKIKKSKAAVKIPKKSAPYTEGGITYIPTEKPPSGKKFRGLASFYGYNDGFDGKKTSNGEVFDMHGLTAAHKTWPFNIWVEVRNLSNGRTVIVRINDRGPFVGKRIIDISYGAAKAINMIEAGVQEVEIEILP